MRTSILRHIIVCLLIVSFASQSLARYAHRNSDSYYLAAFKDHLRNLHANLDNLTLECCRENRNDKAAICDPKIVKPSEEVQIKDESKNRRKETGLLRRVKLDMGGRTLGIRCHTNGDVVSGLREEEIKESKKIIPMWWGNMVMVSAIKETLHP